MTRFRLLRLAIGCLAVSALLAAGCGDDTPEGYTAEARTAMVTACAEDDTDPDIVEVCECTYDTAEDELDFEEFAALEERLADGEATLSDDLVSIIRDCIRSVSATR